MLSHACVRVKKMSLLHNAMTEIIRPLMGAGEISYEVKEEEIEMFICHLFVVSYFCNIPKGKDKSCVKHGTYVNQP